MDNILLDIQNQRCLVDMYDIIVYFPNIHEHISRLKDVFQRKANLNIQPDKCEAHFEHISSKEGVKAIPY